MLKRKQLGLSLVELMVAMVLGLLITAGVTQLFLTNRLTANLQQGLASVQEQGRFAVDFLSREMMAAGYGNVDKAILFPVSVSEGEDSSANSKSRFMAGLHTERLPRFVFTPAQW